MNREMILGGILAVILIGVFGSEFLSCSGMASGSLNRVTFQDKNNELSIVKVEYRTEILTPFNYRKSLNETNAWNYGAKQDFVDKTTPEVVFTVQLIMGDGALINDNIYSVGEMIYDHEIIAIDETSQTVTLRGPDSEKILSVSE